MKKVVVIEQNQLIQLILRSWLTKGEFDVMLIESTIKLNDRIKKFQPDLIITDNMLLNTTNLVNTFSQLIYPKLVISSSEEKEVKLFAAKIKAVAYYAKPINLKEVFVFVHDYFFEKNRTKNSLQL
jgi:DNA-binding response OmpR family regulator